MPIYLEQENLKPKENRSLFLIWLRCDDHFKMEKAYDGK